MAKTCSGARAGELSDTAMPYIVIFQMVDSDKDGKISAAEFKTACGKGWVQSADASTTK